MRNVCWVRSSASVGLAAKATGIAIHRGMMRKHQRGEIARVCSAGGRPLSPAGCRHRCVRHPPILHLEIDAVKLSDYSHGSFAPSPGAKRRREIFLSIAGNIAQRHGLYVNRNMSGGNGTAGRTSFCCNDLRGKNMKKLLALSAALCLGWSMLGCAEHKSPPPTKANETTPAPGPSGEAKPDGGAAPAEPAPTEKKE